MNTMTIVKRLKKRAKIQSDYAVAKALRVKPQTVSCWRHKINGMSDETAERAAELLQLPYDYVLVCLQAERSKHPNARRALMNLAARMLRQRKASATD